MSLSFETNWHNNLGQQLLEGINATKLIKQIYFKLFFILTCSSERTPDHKRENITKFLGFIYLKKVILHTLLCQTYIVQKLPIYETRSR